jgi:hypothetical protein
MSNTQTIASRYHELALQSKWTEIQDELHDENVVCQEPAHAAARGVQVITQGKEAVKAKAAANRAMIETIHEQFCSEPLVAGDFFTLVLRRDLTFKNRPRLQTEEVGVFQVRDGKIISEQFFY